MRRVFLTIVLLAIGACADPPPDDALDVTAVLSGDTAGYARASAPRAFRFPDDHGPHSAFKTEWWYFTGNLASEAGEDFGFQLTFFRSALSPDTAVVASRWRSRHVYMAHFALSDPTRGRFHSFERFGRGAAGLAGASAQPFRVWLDDWRVLGHDDAAVPSMSLSASQGGVSIELQLDALKPPVLQGVDGLSQKGSGAGNASYYYSLTRLRARGAVGVDGGTVPVEGTAWMDREWSTSVLEDDQVGWDWFALQLDDTTEVMVYQLRRRDGAPDPFSRGVVVDPRGGKTDLLPAQFRLDVLDRWKSPRGAVYPSRWRLGVDAAAMDLTIEPALSDQELDVTFRYWEGAVRVTGTHRGRDVAGAGYVEMTGYGP